MSRRKIFTGFLLLISLLGLSAAVWFRREGPALSTLRITAEEGAAIKSEREPAHSALFSKILWNEYPLFADESAGVFYYSLIEGSSTAYDPPVRLEGAGNGVRAAWVSGEITAESIARDEPLQLLVYNRRYYREYSVHCTTLPLIAIESEIEELHGAGKDRDLKVTFFDNRADARQHLFSKTGLIHIRGNSMTEYPKLSYKMTFYQTNSSRQNEEADVSLLGMRSDGEWLLYAGYNDQERIRNVFSSEIWFQSCAGKNEFAMSNGNEYRFAELFMNGKYWGLYALGSPLDSRQMRPLKHADPVRHVYVFKKTFWREEYSTLPENLLMRDYECKGPDTLAHETEARAMLADYDQWVASGAEGSASEKFQVRPDMGSAIDAWLFILLTQGMDTVQPNGDFINMFLTLVQTQYGAAAVYTPWDLDLTWGNQRQQNVLNSTVPYGIDAGDNSYRMLRNPANRLAEEDQDRLADRYRELRSGPWSEETLLNLISGYETQIFGSGAYRRDIAKWPGSTQEDPSLGLSFFADYVIRRLDAMDALFFPEDAAR